MKQLASIILLVTLFSSCSKQERNYTFSLPDNYRSWKKPIEELLTYPVPGHGSGTRIIFANEISYALDKTQDSEGNTRYNFPEGSIVIKEVYAEGEDPAKAVPALTIMVKQSSDPRNEGGWLYYMVPPNEKPLHVKSKMCVGCHAAANETHPYFDNNPNEEFRDYIFAPF